MTTLYRAEDLLRESGAVDIWIREHEVISVTHWGYWVSDTSRRKGKRFVYAANSRYAFATVAEALENYQLRKVREMAHGVAKVRKARAAMDTVKMLIAANAQPMSDWTGSVLHAPDNATNIRDVRVEVVV